VWRGGSVFASQVRSCSDSFPGVLWPRYAIFRSPGIWDCGVSWRGDAALRDRHSTSSSERRDPPRDVRAEQRARRSRYETAAKCQRDARVVDEGRGGTLRLRRPRVSGEVSITDAAPRGGGGRFLKKNFSGRQGSRRRSHHSRSQSQFALRSNGRAPEEEAT